jgi:hypothetical protein
MALYTLTLRDGSTLDVEAPEGASREDLARAATEQRRRQQYEGTAFGERLAAREERIRASQEQAAAQRAAYESMFAEPDESGFFGDLIGGFGAGVVGLGELGALGAATLLDEEQELAARERIQGAASAIRPSMGDEEDLTYKVGQAFGSIAGAVGVAAAAAYGAAALGAGAAGAGIAGLLGAGTVGVAAGAGEASERAREFGATEEERNRAALLGAAIGATEALPLGRVIGPIASRLAGDLGEEAVKSIGGRIQRALRTGGEEAAQEAAANILQNLNERGYNAEQAILEGAGEAAGVGGVAGGAIQLLVDTFAGRRAPSAPAPAEEPPLALPAPSMQVTPEGQALTEEQRREREAVLGDMPRDAVIGERGTARQPTPEELAFERGRETIAAEEQRAQAAAREREALRAAQRGDEAAFEQPDLFALQQEQERRRLGPEELRRPDQFMDELLLEEAEVRTPEQPAAMGDLVEMADQRQRAAQEDADIAGQLAAIEAEEGAQQQQAAALRAESDLETIAGQQETQRQQATEQGRRRILQDVIEKTPSRNYTRVSRVYQDALAAAGYRGDRAKPTEAELQTIQRAVNVQRAERPAQEPVQEAPIEAAPEATQLQEMEARIPERAAQREPEQLGMPGIRRRVQQAPAREGVPPEAAPAPEVVTDAMLDEMGIAPRSPIRQRLRGKDINDPTTRQILTSFANQPRTAQAAQLGISRRLEGVPPEQPDLFAPRSARRAAAPAPAQQAPVRPAAQPAPTAQPRTAEQLELLPETAQGVTDVTPAPDQQGIRRGVRGGGRGLAGRGGAGGTGGRPRTPTAPASRGLGERGARPIPAPIPTAEQRPALGGTRRLVLPVLEVGKRRTEALAPRERAAPTAAAKSSTEQVTKQLADWYEANVSAPAKRFVKELGLSITNPLTIADKTAILEQLNTKSTKENKATVGALKKYLGAYPDPALGLQDAIDDVVAQTPNFRRTEDMTDGESEFFGATKDGKVPARGKNAAQYVLDWASKNMSEATKRWMAGKTAESKNAMQAVEAFEATDLVAKRRELEKAFEGGFDPTKDADNKRLAEVLEKLGIDETDPMVRGLMASGSLFNMAVPPSRHPLSQITTALLRKGDLAGALRSVAASSADPEVVAVAEKLAKVVGNTKVEVVKSLPDGVFGRYDAATNTISLAEGGGLNTHVLLHEMTHAATVATLANKGHPLTRKLQKIFDETREHMPTAYGSTTLAEFVAEAFTNPKFQRMLAGLRVKGEPLTPFAKIKAAISNFLRSMIGKPVKPVESALEQATGIIDNILAPAPSNIGTGEFFMLSPQAAGKRVEDMLKGITDKIPAPTKEFTQRYTDRVDDFLRGDAADAAKTFLLYSLPLIGVVNSANKAGFKGAKDLWTLMEEQRGAINKSDDAVNGVLAVAKTWVRKNGTEAARALNSVIYKSTIEQVDPTKPISAYNKYRATFTTADSSSISVEEYSTAAERDAAIATHIQNEGKGTAKKAGDPDPEKIKAWKAMRKDWSSLGPEGQKVYTQMRDSYRKQYEMMKDVIFGRIDDTAELSPESRNTLKSQVYARLFDKNTIEPYFPLTRSGDYWLSYNRGGEFVVEAFETRAARERAIKQLEQDSEVSKIDSFVNIKNVKYANAPEGSFVKQTLQLLDANKVDPAVKEEFMRLFIETLPETSFAKSLQRRQGTPGYVEDAIGAFSTKAFDLGRQIERLRYSAKIMDWQKNFEENNFDLLKTDAGQRINNELMQRANFARNPPKDAIAQNLNRGAFLFTLGFNVSSAIVNTSQIPMVVIPMLGGRYGYGATGRAINNSRKLFTGSGFSRKTSMLTPYGNDRSIKSQAMPSIDNYFELDANGDFVIRKDLELEPELRAEVEKIKPLMQMMSDRGQLNRSLIADTLGLDSSGRDRSAIDYVSSLGAFFFHNAEVFNRQVTAMTAYQLALSDIAAKEPNLSLAEQQTKAAERALEDSQMMNGGSVLETAPRIAQKGVGRIALMYKQYGIQMYYTLIKTARDGIDAHFAGDKEARNIAARQLAGVIGSTFVLAGVVGLPFAREIMQLIDFFFFDDEEDDVETVVRKAIGEGFYKGPLTELLGVDLSSRIGLSGLIFQANRFNSDPSPEEDILFYFGGPAWSTVSSILRGMGDFREGEFQRGMEAILPSGFRNVSQTLRFMEDGGILSRRGDFITDDLSFGELAAKAIGFAPAEYTRTQEMNQQTKNIDRAVNTTRTKLLRQVYIATRMGDSDERRRTMERIREFNRRHPTARIDADSLRRSMRQHMETSATMYNGITISPNMRRALEESRNEWDQGFQLF